MEDRIASLVAEKERLERLQRARHDRPEYRESVAMIEAKLADISLELAVDGG